MLWRPPRRRRAPLAPGPRAGAVTMWQRRRGSAGWWWQPGKGSAANTLVPRRSGIALPSQESEISFWAPARPLSDRLLLLPPGFCSLCAPPRGSAAPGSEDEPAGTGDVDGDSRLQFYPRLPLLTFAAFPAGNCGCCARGSQIPFVFSRFRESPLFLSVRRRETF